MSTRTTRPGRSVATWWLVGLVGVVSMSAVAVWFGISATTGRVSWVNTGFEVMADDRVDIRFDLRRDPARAVVCVLEALDERHAVVGSSETTVESSESSPSRHIATLRTAGPAVTGYVDTCRYRDQAP